MKINKIVLIHFFISAFVFAQQPYRVGTTAANFLEIGFGSAYNSMGDAGVSFFKDVSAVYWNPAGLAMVNSTEANFSVQPWVADINTSFLAFGYHNDLLGNLGLSVYMTNFGEEDVTTIDAQDGTGEKFDGLDLAIGFTYARKLADWFSFGITTKYISSRIWHQEASAFAMDLGAIVNTGFFAWNSDANYGLTIGVSISNYGTKLSYDGLDLKRTYDIVEDENGNYEYIPVKYELESWELPLIFRIGISTFIYKDTFNSLMVSVDALHPNNNSESINVGGEYTVNIPSYGEVSLRSGYKALFMESSEYGLSFGAGVKLRFLGNRFVNIDYAYRSLGILGSINSYSIGFSF